MNTYNLSLSSNDTEYLEILEIQYLEDLTNLVVSLSSTMETFPPASLSIDWGDGVIEIFENDLFSQNNPFIKSSVLLDVYDHLYYPSTTSLYKNLSAQFLLSYPNQTQTWFVVPMQIRTNDYYQSIENISLKDVTILDNEENSKEYHIFTGKDSFLIEFSD